MERSRTPVRLLGILQAWTRTSGLRVRSSAMKLKFDCIFYYVSDLDRSIRFYTNVLGFKLSSRDFVARFFVMECCSKLCPGPTRRPLRAMEMRDFAWKWMIWLKCCANYSSGELPSKRPGPSTAERSLRSTTPIETKSVSGNIPRVPRTDFTGITRTGSACVVDCAAASQCE